MAGKDMKDLRLCDDAELNRVYNACINNNFGIEIQGFYNPNLIDAKESDTLISEYKKLLKNFKYGKSLAQTAPEPFVCPPDEAW